VITSTAADESCPGCGQIEGVELTSSTPRVVAWTCTRCGMCWAVSPVHPLLPMVVTAHGHPWTCPGCKAIFVVTAGIG
jgi:ferredoxin